MSPANAGLTPEQIKKNRDILNDHRVFIDTINNQPISVEMEAKIAEFLKATDELPPLPEEYEK